MSRYTTIKVQRGNDFEIHMKPVMLNGAIISASELSEITVKVIDKEGNEFAPDFEVRDKILAVKFNDSMELGLYDTIVHAKWQGNDIEDARKALIEIVEWTTGIQFTTYKQELVLVGSTNADMDALRRQYEQAIAEAAAAKADAEQTKEIYQEKMAQLEGIAREASIDQVKATLLTLGKEASLDAIREYMQSLGKELTLHEIQTVLAGTAKEATLNYTAKEATLTEMKSTLAALMTYASQIKGVVDAIATKCAGMDVKIDTINTNAANTKGKVYELDGKVANLSANMDDYKADADSQRAAIKTVVDEIEGHLHPTE